MKSGQILIIVLLVIVVVLAVGLSAASRNIINLRTSTQSEQSQRAFSAAEGGVEEVLSKLNEFEGVIAAGGTVSPTVDVGDFRGVQLVVSGNRVYENSIPLGNVGQIKLTDENNQPVVAGQNIRIEWAKTANSNEVTGSGPASVEIAQIYGSAPSFDQERYYWAGVTGRSGEDVSSNPAGIRLCPGFVVGEFNNCVEVTTLSNAKILRIKPFYSETTVRVSGVGFDLPVQTYEVTSTATTDIGVTRRVQVTRTALPQLPAIFDYVLYSEGDVIK